MKGLRYYLAELCDITRNWDFRFIGYVAPLPAKTMWQWYDLVCDLINYARILGKYVQLKLELMQAPSLFSFVSVSGNIFILSQSRQRFIFSLYLSERATSK